MRKGLTRTNGDDIVLTPVRARKRARKLDAALEQIDARYGKVFKRLAGLPSGRARRAKR